MQYLHISVSAFFFIPQPYMNDEFDIKQIDLQLNRGYQIVLVIICLSSFKTRFHKHMD